MKEEARKERERRQKERGVCKVSERRDRAGKIGSDRRG